MGQVSTPPVTENDVGRCLNSHAQSLALTLWYAFQAYFTGKARPGQKPIFRMSAILELLLSQLWLAAFILAGLWLTKHMPTEMPALWPLWALAYAYIAVLITGRLRYLSTGAAHYATHNCFVGNRAGNMLIASLCLAITLGNPVAYWNGHIPHHQRKIFTTIKDPDTAYLDHYGFRPGMTKSALWWHLFWTCVSPIYHLDALRSRLQSVLRSSPRHLLFVMVWLGLLGTFCFAFGWLAFILLALLPLTVLFQISVLLQLLTEHTWKPEGEAPKTDAAYAERCAGRFCAVPLPKRDDNGPVAKLAWLTWALSMAFIQAPVRFGVLVSDLTVHDFHHLGGKLGYDHDDWMMSRFDREDAIQRGDALGLATRENWGLKAMLNWQFENYAAA